MRLRHASSSSRHTDSMKPPSLKVRLLVRLCALLLFNLSLHLFLTDVVRGAESKSDSEWQRTVEAAKKEGKVGVFLYQRENIKAARPGLRAGI